MNNKSTSYMLLILGIGFLIWFLATLAFRFAGQFFFITDSPIILSILYLAVIPVLSLISVFTFKKFKLIGLENVLADTLMVLPE